MGGYKGDISELIRSYKWGYRGLMRPYKEEINKLFEVFVRL